jgi:hypothetical protein
MKFQPGRDANELRFVFAGGTNLNPKKDHHMHDGVIRLIDDKRMESIWTGYQDGKAEEKPTRFRWERASK